eukprot:Nk52_evm35s2449 gene=Nk52_evmTU35s2449
MVNSMTSSNKGSLLLHPLLLLLLLLLLPLFLIPTATANNDEDTLHVHIIAHTHDDVGWLKTVDEYYLGSHNEIQKASVRLTIDTVVAALLANPERRFIYVEIAFFKRWWMEQSEAMRDNVKMLVKEGRLEFINGGMSMNDEACVHFRDAITNMAEGFEFLEEHFGVRPRVGWHIDPFGHASAQAALYADMGFEAFIITRIDYEDRNKRLPEKRMEFIWRGSNSVGDKSEIFTSIMSQHYCSPGGFNFQYDLGTNDEPINDNMYVKGYNVDTRANELVKVFRQYQGWSATNNILIPFGCDFTFMNAFGYFQNMDKLIKYINEHPEKYNINVRYSTPSLYIDGVKKAIKKKGMKLEIKYDDFFPYNDNLDATWSGFFTSRPGLKGYVRSVSAFYSSAQSLIAQYMFRHGKKFNAPALFAKNALVQMGEVMGILQHHDAVSGTSKQAVAYDYAQRLSEATEGLESHVLKAVNDIVFDGKLKDLQTCKKLNESVCEPAMELADGKDLSIVLHNSIGQQREHLVRIPVPTSVTRLAVFGAKMTPIKSQLIVFKKQYNRDTNDLVFRITLEPFSFTTVTIKVQKDSEASLATTANVEEVSDDQLLSANGMEVGSGSTRIVAREAAAGSDDAYETRIVFNYGTNEEKHVSRNYLWYKSYQQDGQKSGAYIFRPEDDKAAIVCKKPKLLTVRGPIIDEMYTVFDTKDVKLRDRVTLFPGVGGMALLSATIGHVDLGNPAQGKEYIIRYNTHLKNTEGYFYTDSMGMEYVQRRRNYRPQWNVTIKYESSQNYYPVQTSMVLQDRESGDVVSVLNDRSQAGGSLKDGQMELMIHRRTSFDDGRGVGEAISEPGTDGKGLTITTEQALLVGKGEAIAYGVRKGILMVENPVQMYFSTSEEAAAAVERGSNALVNINGPKARLPENIHLLSAKPVHCPGVSDETKSCGPNVLKIRLHNIFSVGEHSKFSTPSTVRLSADLFGGAVVKSVHEMELGGTKVRQSSIDPDHITIGPMQIRTFVVVLDSSTTNTRKQFAPSEGGAV